MATGRRLPCLRFGLQWSAAAIVIRPDSFAGEQFADHGKELFRRGHACHVAAEGAGATAAMAVLTRIAPHQHRALDRSETFEHHPEMIE